VTEPERTPRAAVVLLASGSGTRVGKDMSKAFLPLAGRPMLSWSLARAAQIPTVTQIVVVIQERDQELALRVLTNEPCATMAVRTVTGGNTRHESEWRALRELAPDIHAGRFDVVVIHDAARPLAGSQLFEDVIAGAYAHGGALPARAVTDLIGEETSRPPPPGDLMAVQTPQAFRAAALLKAYELAGAAGFAGTDTASCVERFSDLEVHWVPGSAQNIKITFPDDLRLAELLLAKSVRDLPDQPGGQP
jgi:2-C-methyl-D-erythritol 4-phosphate cytidylyltransferase